MKKGRGSRPQSDKPKRFNDWRHDRFDGRTDGRDPSSFKNRYWLYGSHAVIAALNNPNRFIHRLLLTKDARARLEKAFPPRLASDAIKEVKSQELNELLGDEAVHQGIALNTSILSQPDAESFLISLKANKNALRFLILDQVTDPHNVGAILRSAAAFGVNAVIATDRHSPSENATLAKAAVGALEHVPYLKIVNLARFIPQLKQNDFWIYGLNSGEDQPLSAVTPSQRSALIVGAEGKGLRPLTLSHCDEAIAIPIDQSAMPSLNVSNATAIALYHFKLSA